MKHKITYISFFVGSPGEPDDVFIVRSPQPARMYHSGINSSCRLVEAVKALGFKTDPSINGWHARRDTTPCPK